MNVCDTKVTQVPFSSDTCTIWATWELKSSRKLRVVCDIVVLLTSKWNSVSRKFFCLVKNLLKLLKSFHKIAGEEVDQRTTKENFNFCVLNQVKETTMRILELRSFWQLWTFIRSKFVFNFNISFVSIAQALKNSNDSKKIKSN